MSHALTSDDCHNYRVPLLTAKEILKIPRDAFPQRLKALTVYMDK